MKCITHNEEDIDANMTSYQGEMNFSYVRLCELFGAPLPGDAYKVDAEWILKFEDGTVATIYNWKDGPNYCGVDGTPVEEIKDWHIGGHNRRAYELVEEIRLGNL